MQSNASILLEAMPSKKRPTSSPSPFSCCSTPNDEEQQQDEQQSDRVSVSASLNNGGGGSVSSSSLPPPPLRVDHVPFAIAALANSTPVNLTLKRLILNYNRIGSGGGGGPMSPRSQHQHSFISRGEKPLSGTSGAASGGGATVATAAAAATSTSTSHPHPNSSPSPSDVISDESNTIDMSSFKRLRRPPAAMDTPPASTSAFAYSPTRASKKKSKIPLQIVHRLYLELYPKYVYELKFTEEKEADVWQDLLQAYQMQLFGMSNESSTLDPFYAYSIPRYYSTAIQSCFAYILQQEGYKREGLFRTGKSSPLLIKQILLNKGVLPIPDKEKVEEKKEQEQKQQQQQDAKGDKKSKKSSKDILQLPADVPASIPASSSSSQLSTSSSSSSISSLPPPLYDLHVLAFCAKNLLRSLPETLLTNARVEKILDSIRGNEKQQFIALIRSLPPTNLTLLQSLFELLYLTACSPTSRMTSESLAKVVGPNLLPRDNAAWIRGMTQITPSSPHTVEHSKSMANLMNSMMTPSPTPSQVNHQQYHHAHSAHNLVVHPTSSTSPNPANQQQQQQAQSQPSSQPPSQPYHLTDPLPGTIPMHQLFDWMFEYGCVIFPASEVFKGGNKLSLAAVVKVDPNAAATSSSSIASPTTIPPSSHSPHHSLTSSSPPLQSPIPRRRSSLTLQLDRATMMNHADGCGSGDEVIQVKSVTAGGGGGNNSINNTATDSSQLLIRSTSTNVSTATTAANTATTTPTKSGSGHTLPPSPVAALSANCDTSTAVTVPNTANSTAAPTPTANSTAAPTPTASTIATVAPTLAPITTNTTASHLVVPPSSSHHDRVSSSSSDGGFVQIHTGPSPSASPKSGGSASSSSSYTSAVSGTSAGGGGGGGSTLSSSPRVHIVIGGAPGKKKKQSVNNAKKGGGGMITTPQSSPSLQSQSQSAVRIRMPDFHELNSPK